MNHFFFILFTIMLAVAAAQAQDKLSDPIPTDPEIRIGKLDNGMTYYIRKNAKPEQRAEFFLIVNAGAMQEDDDQNGLAHFCEHMAFNGTEHFKKHEIINFLQSIGMKFGPEINAFTSYEVTNYMLQKVPVEPEANIDTALLVLFDWANLCSYEDEEIDNERGVIHEEWRTRRSAGFRMSIETDKVVYAGSKYAERDVIGKIDIIDNAPYETFRRFYADWYRPDLQAIVAVGDFDMDMMEKKIRDLFSKIHASADPRPREDYEIPDHEGVRVAIAKDAEARNGQVQVMYKQDVVKDKSTLQYMRDNLKNRLFTEMLNKRLNDIIQGENAPFTRAWSSYRSLRNTKDAFSVYTSTKNNETERSLQVMLTENKRIKEYGFTKSEFDNAKKEVLKWYEKAYNERNNNESSDYTWACFSHFLNNEPMPGDEFSYKFTSSTLPGISLEEVNQLAEKWITDNNVIIVVTGPDNENITIPDETTIREIYNKTIEQKVDPYKEIVVDKPLLSEKPNPSPVVEEKKDEQSGVIRWKLKNGAIVIIKPTDFKKDEVYFRAFSPGGSSLYPDKDYMSASVATEVAGESGLGEFSNIEMRKLLSGKIISLRHSIGEYREDINGVTRPQDIEMFLQMVYLSFTSPRIEESGLNLYLEKQKTRTDNRKLDPSSALWDTVTVTLGQYNYRRRPWSMELLKEAQLDRINAIYRERFSNAADFTFIIVGSVDPETLKPLVETYIGGIPSTGKTEKWKDLNIRYPNGIIEKKVPAEMKVPKGTAYITFTGKAEYSLENRVLLDAIADILDVRYTETIREEQGGTYGVSVRAGINHIPADELYMVINFDCDPGRISDLMNIAYAEIEALKTKGPEQKYVDNFIKNKEKEREEKLRENRYWSNFLYNKYLYGSQETEDQYIEQVRKITADDVKNAAAGLFPNNDHVQIILVPKE